MRSSIPSTTSNLDHSTMYGHTFITDGHDGVICAYNAQGAGRPFTADITMNIAIYTPPNALQTSILYRLVKFVVRSEVKTDEC